MLTAQQVDAALDEIGRKGMAPPGATLNATWGEAIEAARHSVVKNRLMIAALRAVSEQSAMPGDSGDTVVPGFIMDQVRGAMALRGLDLVQPEPNVERFYSKAADAWITIER